MGGITAIPLRRSNREAAGLNGGETIPVTIELDLEIRDVEVPAELKAALCKKDATWKAWQRLSYSNRREAVESVDNAKRPETRKRRIALIAQALAKK
jgi:uncharacterized protein YdeI (YjbR/CyaY-like superfamily)